MKKYGVYKRIFLAIIVVVLANLIAANFHSRFDVTIDHRYTLSQATKNIIDEVDSPVLITVFLDGDFPPQFRRLQNETTQLLEEFGMKNDNIRYEFVNPLGNGGDANAVAQNFYKNDMDPARVSVKENGKTNETVIFPWAVARYGDKTVKIPLLKNNLGTSDKERVNNSVQQLEYAFTNAISQLVEKRTKKVAIMRGNGELPNANIADFIKTIKSYYLIAPFTLDSTESNPQKTLQELESYDLVIEAKPTEAFSEKEKYVLDQYVMHGGKMIWLTDQVAMENDSLFNPSGTAFALPRNLNLSDYFFSYGIRINPVLINDIYSAPIVLATGQGSNTQFTPYPWFYSPLSASPNSHPIINNIEAVKFSYASQIDTLKNRVKKTILLSSSPETKIEGTPREISLKMSNKKPDLATYTSGEQPLAVLLEGQFKSVYKNRVKPFEIPNSQDQSKPTQMIVIADGDVIKNELQKGKPLELGFDRYTGNTYGNKEFLLNSVNYLLDDSGLIDIRSKNVSIAFLNSEKIAAQRTKWQFINLILPLILLGIGALLFNYFRKRRYLKK